VRMLRLVSLVLPCLAALLGASASAPCAAELETISSRAFDVRLEPAGGQSVVVVDFALALSEVSSYPVTITAIGGAGEEVLYESSLPAGVYRVRAPLTKVSPAGLRVVLRTRVTNRTDQGSQTYIVYQKWENR